MDICCRCHCVTFPNLQYLLGKGGYGPMPGAAAGGLVDSCPACGRTVLLGTGGNVGEEHQTR